MEVEILFDWPSLDCSGGISFKTTILRRGDGKEFRSAEWQLPVWRGNLGSRIVNQQELDYLRDWFLARQGRAEAFRIKDPTDYRAVNQPLVQISPTEYQLIKRYQIDNYFFNRQIHRPLLNTLEIYENNVLVPANNYSVNGITGLVTFSAPPTGVLRATFEFCLLVRFDIDELPQARVLAIENSNCANLVNLYELDEIPLVEVRSPTNIPPGNLPNKDLFLDIGFEIAQQVGRQTVTLVRTTQGQWEKRVPLESPKTTGSTAARTVTGTELEFYLTLFRLCRGQLIPFRWIDWSYSKPRLREVRFATDEFPTAKLVACEGNEGDQRLYELEAIPIIETDSDFLEVELCPATFYCFTARQDLVYSTFFCCPMELNVPEPVETFYCPCEI